ncbi:MAG TPA: universal stress protein [Candidatus Baltobacteraceae bacterium]|nr:universal stress protein [Candidatus Baltobacteraceae bacterium]
MSTFQRILVPVDGSEPSDEAIALAIRLAGEWSSELTFCFVVDSDRIIAECASTAMGDPGPILSGLEADAESILAAAAAKAAQADLKARTNLLDGVRAVEGINRLAETEKADLIIMGSHGRRGLSRVFMGSTTEGVLRQSSVPVLVVRATVARTGNSAVRRAMEAPAVTS